LNDFLMFTVAQLFRKCSAIHRNSVLFKSALSRNIS
jgi:hypothetical protein